jgi:hypothetical protein
MGLIIVIVLIKPLLHYPISTLWPVVPFLLVLGILGPDFFLVRI